MSKKNDKKAADKIDANESIDFESNDNKSIDNNTDKKNASEQAEIKNGKAENKKDGKKQPSETDLLKIYLEKTLSELGSAKKELEKTKKELDGANASTLQLKEKLTGVVNEYDNYRRRTAEEKETIKSDAVAKAVNALLPAVDSLERSVSFADSNPESFKQGVEMTLKQLVDGFRSLGVTEIEAQGLEFDPSVHNAVMHVDDESLGESVVTEVFQKGYKIGDKVIRHSVVKVAN